jgi:putative membrane protein
MIRSLLMTGVGVMALGTAAYGQAGNAVYTLSPDKPMNGYYGKSSRNPIPASLAVDASWMEFVRQAAVTNKAEVKLAELAQERGSNESVKEFARMMVEDHSKADNELTQIAKEHSVNVPTQLDAKHRALYNRLSKLSGEAFDRAYSKAMVDGHKQAVAMFQARANNGRNTDLRVWAANTLPKLRHHLEMALDMRADVTGRTSSSGSSTIHAGHNGSR